MEQLCKNRFSICEQEENKDQKAIEDEKNISLFSNQSMEELTRTSERQQVHEQNYETERCSRFNQNTRRLN